MTPSSSRPGARRARRQLAGALGASLLGLVVACNGITGIGDLHRADDTTCVGPSCTDVDGSVSDDGGGTTVDGGCTKDCLGGACSAGVCQPVVLATGQAGPVGIAVDGQRAYWANRGDLDASTGSVTTSWLDGGDQHDLVTGQPSAGFVALDPSYVYLTDQGTQAAGFTDGRVVRIKKDGTAVDRIYDNQTAPFGIALDSTFVYWTNALGGDVHRALLDGGGAPTAIAPAIPYAYGIAVDPKNVAWVRVDPNDGGDVRIASPSGGDASVVASGQGGPRSVAMDATSVYWVNEEDGRVMKAARTGGAPVELAKGQDGPRSVALDDTYVYWANSGSASTGAGSIARVGKDGKCASTSCPEVLAAAQSRPYGLAVDAVAVYWVNFTSGNVLRVAK